jgi:hypothetical protein
MELGKKLAEYPFDDRCERYIGPSRCRVVIWLWIDPHGAGVSHAWASEYLLCREGFGSEFGCLLEESSVVPISCCVFSLADMIFPWIEHLESCDFVCSTSFSEILLHAYAEAKVEECLTRSLRHHQMEDLQG